ncbi:MAG: hypothetical protein HUU15_09585 [Candidatus Brocadiae bacterium]|nr:hypothetical protein [Candidatus Brocadiia bacterium]
MLKSWTLQVGAAVLGALFTFACPAFAGDCCEKGDKEAVVVVSGTPEECFTSLCKAMHAGDSDAMFSLLTPASQEALLKKGEVLKEVAGKCAKTREAIGVTEEQAKEMSGRDLAIAAMMAKAAAKAKEAGHCEEKSEGCGEKSADEGAEEKTCGLTDLKVEGDVATAKCPFGMPLTFNKTKDGWRMDITAALAEGCESKKEGCESKKEGCEKKATE